MKKPYYTLLENFEFRGIWWLPDKPDLKIPGTLSFDNNHKFRLELQGSFYDYEAIIEGKDFRPEIILGISNNGKYCTLLYNIQMSANANRFGIPETLFDCKYLFVDIHFRTPDSIVFSSIHVSFTNLESWLYEKPFVFENREKDDKAEFTLTYKFPSDFSVEVEALNSVIGLSHYFHQEGEFGGKITLQNKAYLIIEPKYAMGLEWYFKVFYNLRNFLTLLIGEATYITYIKASNVRPKVESNQEISDSIEIYFPQNRYEIIENIHPIEMIIAFPDISKSIIEILKLWFSKAEQLFWFSGNGSKPVFS